MQRLIFSSFAIIFFFLIYFLLNSTNFERINPTVQLSVVKDKYITYLVDTSFYNPENDIKLNAFDSSGLSSYSVKVTNSRGEVLLENKEILLRKSKKLEVTLPKLSNLKNGDEILYSVSVYDWSNANFFKGNKTNITRRLIINTLAPQIQIVATSEQITHGGSALIAFTVRDLAQHKQQDDKQNEGIDKVIVSNGQNNFEAFPFINAQGKLIYISLIAWPITNTFFEGKIQVFDKAMNEQNVMIPISTNINQMRRKLNFVINEKYLSKIIKKLEENTMIPNDLATDIEKFQFFNESIRSQDNQRVVSFFQILKHTKVKENITRLNAFVPISNSTISGRFGDEYTYKYQKDIVGTSTRFGIVLFNNEDSAVISSNSGEVAFIGNLGEYGNLIALNHAFGLSTIYGYLKELPNIPENIESLDTIGYTGQSGFATTNSVYFATLVQGYFVNPQEWMNPEWVNTNINHVLEKVQHFGVRN
ncbi:M23 family peptidase [Helicobacter didelphidarum]|uniref:M23 family peptidase n=1 Tax=Helicobacter didelphidarum TaxID=2040648 RepID=A0A3D8IMQ8_9HELI|nr:M23 family metallopeptidase [Helicobacter didelphidarum]RDU65861.1 M23 family peptidase [Helicobacter didelphidarum]